MIKIIEDKKVIKKCHDQFHDRISSKLSERINGWVGYPSSSFEDKISFYSDLDIWMSFLELDNRYWNGFGLYRPIEDKNNSLVGEINFPIEGINRRIAGAFGKDENGEILVLHRGKIGGGRKGMGKSVFVENFRGDFVLAIDGDRETEFCLVGELNSSLLPRQVSNFIFEINRIKKKEISTSFDSFLDFVYTEESSGKSTTERNETREVNRTHGIIVNALATELKSKGIKVANDKNRDLFIHDNGKVKKLFEIKTDSTTQSICSATGQLLIYSIPFKNPVDLIAVLPNALSSSVQRRLKELKIKVLEYELIDDKPKFKNINSILNE